MAEQDFIDLGLRVDDAGTQQEIEAIFTRALSGISGELSKALSKGITSSLGDVKKFQTVFNDIGGDAAKGFQTVIRGADGVERTLSGLQATVKETVVDFRSFDQTGKVITQLTAEIERLKNELNAAGAAGNKELVAGITQQLRSAVNAQNVALQTASRAADTAQKERISSAAAAARAEQDQTRVAIAASKERIVAAQQEGSQVLAATRAQAAERVAITKGVFNVLRGLEDSFGRVISGGSSILGKGITGISSVLSGITQAVRRSDQGLTEGLQSAVNKRTEILQKGFSRQSTVVSEQLSRQERTITRFNEITSTGLTGLAAGRSNAANALGIGGILGGGFLIFNQLKDGIKQAQDFDQTMAVLQAQLGLTNAQMENVRKTSVALGNDLTLPGVSAKDAGDAINLLTKQFGSLGAGAVDAATAAAKGTLQLARATGSSAEDASSLIGSAVNVFKISADEAVTAADNITGALSKAAGVSFSDFKDAFVQGATVFEQFVGPAEDANDVLLDFNTTLAVLAKNGIVGSNAGAGLKQFFLQANKSGKASVNVQKELVKNAGEAGTVFFDAAGNARTYSDSLGIIRKGIAGYNDAQRTAALSTLFGSRSITIANALINESTEDWDALRASIAQQGLAAKIAAAQNQGLRGAMDALGSVIDTLILQGFEKLDKPLGNAVVQVADFINKLATGTGVFQVARDAIKGIVVALGGLLAIKGAVELVQILAAGLGAVLTPIGLLITGVAAAGAAIAILEDRSSGFRDFLDGLKKRAIDLGSAGIAFLQEKIGQLADFISGSVIPRIVDLADVLQRNFVAAFDVASHFIETTAIPALQRFISFITGTVVPAVRDKLVSAFQTAADAVVGFWHLVQPVIEPAISGIQSLVDAVIALSKTDPGKALLSLGGIIAAAVGGFAVGGPAGAAIAGAGATVAAIFANGLQDNLVDALSGIGSVISNAFSSLLAKINIGDLVGKAFASTSIAQRIGEFLGKTLSSPQLVTAVAGVAAFAATVAGRFLLGFGQGVLSNVPALARLLGQALKLAFEEGIKFALDNPLAIVTAISAVFLGRSFLGLFKTAGTQAGTQLQQGLLGSLRANAFGGALQSGGAGFFTTFLFGPGGIERSVANTEAAARNAAARIKAGMVSTLQQAGRLPNGIFTPTAQVQEAYDKLAADVGPGGLLALKLKAAFSAGFKGLAASIKTGSIGPLKSALVGLGSSLGEAAAAVGKNIGAAIAGGIAGFQTGKALAGQSGVSQLLGVGGLALSIGAVNPVAGAAAGALGLLGVAMGNMGKKAEAAKQQVKDLSDAISQAGNDATGKLKNISQTIFTDLQDKISPGGLQKILKAGFDLTDVVQQVTEQGKSVDEVISNLINNKAFAKSLQEAGVSGKDAIKFVSELRAELEKLPAAEAAAGSTTIFNKQLDDLGNKADTAAGRLKLLLGPLKGTTSNPLADTVGHITEQATAAQKAFDKAKSAADAFFGTGKASTLDQALNEFRVDIPNLQAKIDQISAPDLAPFLKSALQAQLGDDITVQLKGILKVGLQSGQIQPEGVPAFLENLKAEIQGDIDSGQITPEVGLNIIANIEDLANSADLPAQIAALLASDPSQLSPPPTTVKVPITPTPDVKADDFAADLERTLGTLVAGAGGGPQGFGGGSVRGGGGAGIKINIPVNVTASSNAAEAGAGVAAQFAQGIAAGIPAAALAGAAISGAGVRGLGGSVGAARGVGQTLGASAASGMASAISAAAVAGAGLAAAFRAGIASGAGGAISAARALGAAASAAVATSTGRAVAAGQALGAGLAAGIRSSTGGAVAAARAMAAAVTAAAQVELGIHSPSRVFFGIGGQIVQGLAQGIAAAASSVQNVLADLLKGLSDTTTSRAAQIGAGLADLFDQTSPTGPAGLGSPTSVAVTRASIAVRAAQANLFNDLAQSNQELADAIKAVNEGTASGLQQTIARQGVGAQSLDINTVVGGENASAFLDAGEKVVEFFKTLLESEGNTIGGVQDAIHQTQSFRDQLILAGGAAGASADAMNALLVQLGLTDNQLNTFAVNANNVITQANKQTPPADQDEKDKEIAKLQEQLRVAQLTPTRPIEVNVTPPFGDPEAIGLGVANRVATALGAVI